MNGIFQEEALHFAVPGLPARAGYPPLAANHSGGYAFGLHARPGHAHPSPSIRDLMKNPG